MKKMLLFLVIINSIVFSQAINKKIAPIDIEKSSKTFFEIQKEFNENEKMLNIKNGKRVVNGIESKVPNWKLFKRDEWLWENRINLETGEFPKTNSIAEYEKYKKNNVLKKESDLNENWTNLGTNSSTGGYAGIGRINCVAFHPTDANTFWVGSPSGGIWKTTDGGSSWTILNNNMPVLGVSGIAITSDYATSNTLYIATGDRDGGSMWSLSGGQAADNISQGVFKSTDGGATWSATGLTSTESGTKTYRLLIHPSDDLTLFASTSNGIYKTTDGGISWTKKTSNSWIDMEFKPGDPTIMYASSYGYSSTYINRSTDSGENWSFSIVAASGRRGELAVSENDPTVVYLLAANSSGGVDDVYKSTNSGASFTALGASSKSMLGYYSDGSGTNSGQGTYDLCIAASPSDANTVYIGGVNTWKSVDGGTNWVINNMWTSHSSYNFSSAPVAHADKHTLAFQSSGVLFEGNDGGIYKTTNGGTNWTDLSNGLVISQLYRIGVSQTSSTKVMTGLQDNGSKLFNSGTWSDVKGGDGMECIIDFSDANYMYATYVNGQIDRSSNGTSFTIDISANIPGGQPTGAWVTPYIIDPNNSSALYAGYDRVWKTTNRGNSWASASQVLSSSDKLRSLAIAPSNSLVLYAADRTHMWKTTDGGSTDWTVITLPSTSTSVTYIAVHPTDPNTVWITYGGFVDGQKVYESTDGGANWTSISAGLPNLPIMSIVHYKTITSKNILFVGTDLGVYTKDGANDWAEYNTGLPNVVVAELEIYYNPSGTDKLRAGTYGRGLWETEILSPLPAEIVSFTSDKIGNGVVLNWKTATEVNNYGFEIERSQKSNVKSETWEKVGFVEGHGNSNSPKNYSFFDNLLNQNLSSNINYRLKQVDNNGHFEYSDEISVAFEQVLKNTIEQNHPNPFNPSTTLNYSIADNSLVRIEIYNLLGQIVAELINSEQISGNHSVTWNASGLSSGVYFARFSVTSINSKATFSDSKKLILMK